MNIENYGFQPAQVADIARILADIFAEAGGSATWDPASVAAGAQSAATTITVTGAVAGDRVIAWHTANQLGGKLVAWVSAADTVSVAVHNPTAGAIDIATGTLSVRVVKTNTTS